MKSKGRAWRSRHYLDCTEAIAFVSERRQQLIDVCGVFEKAARFIKEPGELKGAYQRFFDLCAGVEKAVAEVERLAAQDDLVLLALDPRGRYALKSELALVAAELNKAKSLRHTLLQDRAAS